MCFLDKHSTTEPHTYPKPSPSSVDAEAWKKRPRLIHQKSWLTSLQSESDVVIPKTSLKTGSLTVKDGKDLNLIKKYHGETSLIGEA